VVRLRMKSLGRRHRPFFRICAMDSRTPRDGRSIEELGHYDPMSSNAETQTVLNVDRIRYWLGVGAQPSLKVQALLKKHGVKKPAPGEPWQMPKPAAAPEPEAAAHNAALENLIEKLGPQQAPEPEAAAPQPS